MENDNDKCLCCGKPVKQVSDRRPRLYCSDSCRVKYFRVNRMKAKVAAEAQSRSNPLINAARGRDKSGVNEDEGRNIAKSVEQPKSSKPDDIKSYWQQRFEKKNGL